MNKRNNKQPGIYLLAALFCLVFSLEATARSEWDIPPEADKKISFHEFTDETRIEGMSVYENSCQSCHGSPSIKDYALMFPSPGDPADETFQSQSDGSMFYKIQKGKGIMPAFEDVMSDDEIWALIAYIRSFNDKYEQPVPDLEGIEIPELKLVLDFDDNVDKIVVKLTSESKNVEGATVSVFITGMFGNLSLGKEITNQLGIAYFDVDTKMPGDTEGNLNIIAKAKKGYGSAKLVQKLKVVEPTIKKSAIEGRHLWSTSKNAPYWLKFAFYFVVIAIWGTILYIIIGLYRIKKYSKN